MVAFWPSPTACRVWRGLRILICGRLFALHLVTGPRRRFAVARAIAAFPTVLDLTFFRSLINRIMRRRAQLAIFSALSFFCLIATAVLTFQVFFKLEEYSSARNGNISWNLAQVEVDHIQLVSALRALSPDAPDRLRDVRLRFDGVYNRVNTLQHSPSYQSALDVTDAATHLGHIYTELRSLIPVIDADNQTLMAQRDTLLDAVTALSPDVRALSVEGIFIDATRSVTERKALTSKLMHLAFLSLLLVTTLLCMMLLLWRLYLRYRTRAIESRTTLNRLSTILNTSKDAVIVFREDGRIVDTNNTARDLFGLGTHVGLDPSRPVNIADILSHQNDQGDDIPMAGKIFIDACRGDAMGPNPLRARLHDGQFVPVEVSANLATRSDDEVCVCFLRDISDRLAADAEIQSARDKAFEVERAKTKFLARISHEMRTPLHGIIGSLDLLTDTPLRPDQSRYAEVMKSSAQVLLAQIDDAMGVSRSGGPQLDLSLMPFDLDRLLEDLVLSQKPEAHARGTELGLTQDSTGFGIVCGDPDRVHQVLLNLVSNAVKYTENGQVSLLAHRLTDDDTPNDVIEFQIVDTGIGIAQSDISRIFDDYVRLSHAGQDTVEGSGLGLGIARNLVTLMGGEIGAESFEGEGSLFWVRLPLPASPDTVGDPGETAHPIVPHEGHSQSVLLVEDNATNRFVLGQMLVSDGHNVKLASCGLDGVAMATARPYDLIIMDVNMPDINGIEATRRIRTALGPDHIPRIAALTAYFSEMDRTAMAAAGIDEVWTKPLKLADMRALLNGVGARSQAPQMAPDTAAKDRPDIVTDALSELRTSVPLKRLTAFVEQFASEAQMLVESVGTTPALTDDTFAQKLHKLAGSAAVLGAVRAQALLAQAEDAARQKKHPELDHALRQLADILPATVAHLTALLANTVSETGPHHRADTSPQA